ncbi:hypothetical protein BJF79_15400 [Actinomadura sp. CNU-125]|nr:hypothetical protein BJF79_15400 [Actinomadura sp. CNU-125]
MVVQPTAAESASKTRMKVGMAAIAIAVSVTAKTSIAISAISTRVWAGTLGGADGAGPVVIGSSRVGWVDSAVRSGAWASPARRFRRRVRAGPGGGVAVPGEESGSRARRCCGLGREALENTAVGGMAATVAGKAHRR